MVLLTVLDHASVVVFALTGALAASRSQLDLAGFVFISCLTALGGGTARDLILDRTPLWVADASYLGSATCAAVLVFLTAHLFESRYRLLVWLDGLALAVAVAAGVGVATDMGAHWPVVMVMGMLTGCFGGMARDVVCNEVPLVLKQGELYVSCALAGSGVAVLVINAGGGRSLALIIAACVVFALRAGSLALGWRLPVYHSRPPRPESPKR
jgi:uncharacterized membrane protein YeiH